MDKDTSERVIYFAETDFRNRKQRFGIKEKDRSRHMYVIGKTGMGKSTLLENLAIQDIQNGSGLGFIDPHGGSAELLLDHVPKSRIKDVIYFAPFDLENPVSFNVMEDVGKDQRHLVADGLMAAFKKIWPDVWSARMEYILNNILLALIEYPDSTLLGVNRMLADKSYRDMVVAHITDPAVRAFWLDEFAKYTDKYMQEAGAAIQNKIGQFVSSPIIRNIIGQTTSSFNIREAMDSKKILIMNLSKGRMGENNAALLGGMLITKMYLAAMSRAQVRASELAGLPHFYFYVDEFQSFVNESFANILSEARKYKLDLTIAHQYVEQMPEEVRDAVFGNVGTTIAFRVGPLDAELLEKVFAPNFLVEDLVNLGRNQIYLSLMIDGIGSPPFSAKTIPPIVLDGESRREEALAFSRATYAKPRAQVEKLIEDWHQAMPVASGSSDRGRSSSPSSRPQFAGSNQQQRPRPTYQTQSATRATPPGPANSQNQQSNPAQRPVINNVRHNTNNPPPRQMAIPKEAQEALGASNLKDLLANALKEAHYEPNNEDEDEDDGDVTRVYKHEEASEVVNQTEQPTDPAISTEELKKILGKK